jgi:hypothetical protein
MKSKLFDIKVGDEFNNLRIIEPPYLDGGQNREHLFAKCQCACKKEHIVQLMRAYYGTIKSCGCLKAGNGRKHGLHKHPLYTIWQGMKDRCYNKNSCSYPYYGGRNISICDEWKDNFKSFYDWAINNGWNKGLTIEREKVDGNYEPSNCSWIPQSLQSRNQRRTTLLTAFGETKPLWNWWKDHRAKAGWKTIKERIAAGWDAELAISTPTPQWLSRRK